MKTKLILGLLLLAGLIACQPAKKADLLYVGTYSENGSKGIYCYDFYPADGSFKLEQVTPDSSNPSYVKIAPSKKYLYAVGETETYKATKGGSVSAYRIDPVTGNLDSLGTQPTLGLNPCHVEVSPNGKTVVVANYTSGSLAIYPVNEDGSLGKMVQLIRYHGHGPNKERQEGPHAHFSHFMKDGSGFAACDLGTDQVRFFKFSADSNRYVPAVPASVHVAPGSGPRHLVFSANERHLYVISEMASTLTVFEKTADGFDSIQTVSTLPPDYRGEKDGAEIQMSNNGRFIYCSNRGHNSISVFNVDKKTGKVNLIQNIPVEGNWPRNFVLDPENEFLLSANRKSNQISIFSINPQSGELSFTGKSIKVPSPVCLEFMAKATSN